MGDGQVHSDGDEMLAQDDRGQVGGGEPELTRPQERKGQALGLSGCR